MGRGRKNNVTEPWTKNGCLYGQDFHKLRSSHLKSGSLFTDPCFPPNHQSISYTGVLADDAARGGTRIRIKDISWERASTLFPKAKFLIAGSSKNDVNQGFLGNCWFLCALTGITEIPLVFRKVVPEDQGFGKAEYSGIFHFQFWQYGSWVDVVVDDYLPVLNGELLFVKSDDRGEMWPCLVEKAYAKLHGSYWHLNGGWPVEALVDFTGGFPEAHTGPLNGALSGLGADLWQEMSKALEREKAMLTACSLLQEYRSMGIIGGHAYTVLGLEGGKKGSDIPRLVHIRNPWGNSVEWKGPWSDGSREMRKLSKEERRRLTTGQGDYWMAYEDFARCFTHFTICHPEPESQLGPRSLVWRERHFQGEWEAGSSAGGSGREGRLKQFLSNPQYCFSLKKAGEVHLALMQRGRRQLRDEQESGLDTFLPIGITLMALTRAPKRRAGGSSLPGRILGGLSYQYNRTVTIQAELPAGHYMLVPATYFEDIDGEFFLRLHADAAMKLTAKKL